MHVPNTASSTRTSSASRAVAALFALDGFVTSSVYARLPAIKDRLEIDAGALSLALLGMTVGLLLAQAATAWLIARRGSGPVAVGGAVLCAVAVIGPGLAGALGWLVAATILLGVATGALDVAMNVHGAAVERAGGRPILSRLHAVFSLGVLAGSGVAGAVAAAGVGVRPHLVIVAALGVVAAAVVAPRLGPGERPRQAVAAPALRAEAHPIFARPTRALAGAGAIAFCVLLCEGAVADWSAVHLRDDVELGAGAATLGLAAFSVAMVVGRLAGDRVSIRLGARRHVRFGGALAAGGLLLAALAHTAVPAVAGFAVAGLGLSALFPLVVRAAAATPGPAAAIAAVSTAGYVGLVAGPPAVGALAQATSLRASLAIILGTLCLVTILLAPTVDAE
jgi:predicted MFS family arabinose efflux permease